MTKLLIISGSLRSDSFNTALAKQAAALFGGDSEQGNIDLPLYNGDVEAKGIPTSVMKLAQQIAAADAVVIATPEYNQSFSGVLKNALDWVSRSGDNPWADKPVAIITAAAGRAGGARAQYALRLAMTPFHPRLVTGPEVLVANPVQEFDDDGHLVGEHYGKVLGDLMAKLKREIR